jgi:two-component system, NarL family, nitrate/nitrite response regulator NarL
VSGASIAVIVADSRPLLVDALARTIRQEPAFQLAGAMSDGRAVLEALERRPPAVAVLAADLPHVGGARVAAAVARDELPTRVLLLARDEELAAGYDALRTGAGGVLSQRVTAEQLVNAIRRAAGGDVVLCARAQSALTTEIRRRDLDGRPALTQREREVLRLVATGLTAPAIARRLHLSVSTVRTHLAHLFEKLGASERAQLVAVAMRAGLVE